MSAPQIPPLAQPQPTGTAPWWANRVIIVGAALGMFLVISLFTSKPPAAASNSSTLQPAPPVLVNSSSGRELTKDLLENSAEDLQQARVNLAAKEQELQRQMRAQPPLGGGGGQQQEDEIAKARRSREYASLFASNIAFSLRGQQQAGPQSLQRGEQKPTVEQRPYLPTTAVTQSSTEQSPHTEEIRPIYHIYEGTVIESVLLNRLDGSFSGPVQCMATASVYSPDHAHVLFARGAKFLGEASAVSGFGQGRLAIAFHRAIRQDGYSISLDKSFGLDQIGATGLHDQVNNHYFATFGAAAAVGLLSGLSLMGTNYGSFNGESAGEFYRQGVSNSLSQSAMRILDRFLNRMPTITIREGQRVNIWVTKDLDVPEYTG